MKNKLLRLLALCICVLISLCSCHGKKESSAFEISPNPDMSKEYEITFWAKNDTNITQVEIYKEAIRGFNEYYPNIKVNLRLYTDYGRIYNDVITNIATGTTPNVCITYPDHIATYLSGKDTVVNLDSLFKDERYGLGGSEIKFDGPAEGDIIPKFLDECYLNGGHFAVPFMRSTEACYVNKTYVEKLGFTLPETLTWDFVFEVSEAATEKNPDGTFKVNGQKVMLPFIYKSTDNMMIQMLKQKNAGYSDSNGNILIFNDTVRDILHTVADHAETGAFTTFKISSYPANFLNAGQCIFAVDSTAGATWMGSEAPLSDIAEENLVKFETAVMSVPQFDPENPVMISQGPSVCIFNKENPDEVLASWLFVQYLLSNDVQNAYAKTEGYIPVTSKAQNSPEYTDYLDKMGTDGDEHYEVKIRASKLLLDNTENTFVTPVFNGSASLRDASGQMIENVTKSVRRKEKIDNAYMNKLFDDMKSLYRLDGITDAGKGKIKLGKMPDASKALIVSLCVIWAGILVYGISEAVKNKKKSKK